MHVASQASERARFPRHLCELNCLSDGPDKIDHDTRGRWKGMGVHWRRRRRWRRSLSWRHTSSPSRRPSSIPDPLLLSLPLIVREGRFAPPWKAQSTRLLPFETTSRSSFRRLCGQTMLEINRSRTPRDPKQRAKLLCRAVGKRVRGKSTARNLQLFHFPVAVRCFSSAESSGRPGFLDYKWPRMKSKVGLGGSR